MSTMVEQDWDAQEAFVGLAITRLAERKREEMAARANAERSEHAIVCEGGVILVNHGDNMGPEYTIRRFDGLYPAGGEFHWTEEEARIAVNATEAEMAEYKERERRESQEHRERGRVLAERAAEMNALLVARRELGSYLRSVTFGKVAA